MEIDFVKAHFLHVKGSLLPTLDGIGHDFLRHRVDHRAVIGHHLIRAVARALAARAVLPEIARLA